MRHISTVLLALATSGLVSALYVRARAARAAAEAVDPEEFRRLRERITGLEALVFRALGTAASAPPAPGVSVPLHREPPAVHETREAPTAVHEALAKRRRRLDQQLASEAVDAAWARDVKSRVESWFRRDGREGLSLASLECRTSICKLEIASKEPMPAMTLLGLLGADLATFGEVSTSESADGLGPLVLYTSRAGAQLD